MHEMLLPSLHQSKVHDMPGMSQPSVHETQALSGDDHCIKLQAMAAEARGPRHLALHEVPAQILQQVAGVSQRKPIQEDQRVC